MNRIDLSTRDFRKIGLWQTAFLGDAVLTLPFIQALKARYPGAEIHYFVRAGLEGLFSAQRELTSVRGFAKRGNQKSLFAARALGHDLSLEGFDLWISPHASLRSAFMARSVGAPVRIGYHQPWYNWLAYTHLVDRSFSRLEEIERIFQLGGPLGIFADKATPAPLPRLDLTDEAKTRAAEIFDGLPVGPKLGIHPGSTWPTKCWPKEHFAEIARRALDAGAVVLLFAGPGEEALAAHIANAAGDASGRLINLANMLTIPALAACLGRLDACLTNDSGPMHLTWAQGVPLAACFGPTVRSLGFFPRGQHSRVLETALDCRPCGLHGHKACPLGHHNCMKDISPDRVWDVLRPMLGV
ncbi:MAG: glycosyltransferase family 9 protein [Humidesulfovibrio sp.]|jgi:heptosyltransferase-2|uniref:glycosyltransferase family 9 protein n=1 Tax=Humidesulfovibrio sp. TaxID=2910988 RepID=UPI00273262F5|nr:glycosyltransferase family 9 protein [Humidesulfovibrio sp.]MDP2846838.1 glycosyltransferase family 9 protein [Humidesulfovibrio sp.]